MTRDEWPKYICCVLTVREELIAENPAMVQDLVNQVLGAGTWLDQQQANREKAAQIAAGRQFFNQDPNIIRFVMENPTDRVTYGDLRMIRAEFEELMQLSLQAGTIKHPIAYEKYVDERFARARASGRPFRYEAPALAPLHRCCSLAVRRCSSRRPTHRRSRPASSSPPRQAPEFSLQGSDGRELNLSRYRGKVVLLGFGFTSCPSVCPTTLATLAQARRKLGAAAADVQIVYITVDPERDNAERMKEYLARLRSDLRRRHRHGRTAGRRAQGLRRLAPRRRRTATTTRWRIPPSPI